MAPGGWRRKISIDVGRYYVHLSHVGFHSHRERNCPSDDGPTKKQVDYGHRSSVGDTSCKRDDRWSERNSYSENYNYEKCGDA